MRRRRTHSLDTLLDTLCNAFGAVLLMALLAALQVRAAALEAPTSAPADPLADLRAEVEAAERALTEPHLPADLAEWLQRRADAQRALDDALAQRNAASAARADLPARRDTLERDLAAAAADLETARADADEAEARAEASQRRVRLPLQHDVRVSAQVSLLVDGDRVYRLTECEATPQAHGGTYYRPRPDEGTRVQASTAASLLRHASTRTTLVSFWVSDRAPSFATFQTLRAATMDLGFEYSVAPFDATQGLTLHPGLPRAE